MADYPFAPVSGALLNGCLTDFYHHQSPDAAGNMQTDSFAVAHPLTEKGTAPLYVVLHSAGHDLFSCMGCTFEKNNHDIYRKPDEMYGLYVDCRFHQNTDFWWGGINAHDEGEAVRRSSIQPVETRILNTVLWTIKNYPIDENRVYICGNSMGGSGALGLGLNHGDIFAAIKVNVPAGVRHCADRCLLDKTRPAGFAIPDPPVVIDYSAQNDAWSDGHEVLYSGMRNRKYALYGYWADFGHANSNELMMGKNDLIHSLDWLSIQRNQAYPVFTNASTDDMIPWPEHRDSTAAGQVNGFFRWKNLTDSEQTFEMELRLISKDEIVTRFTIPESSITDLSFRRLQNFHVRPGQRVAWSFGNQHGTAIADDEALITIPHVMITSTPAILSLSLNVW